MLAAGVDVVDVPVYAWEVPDDDAAALRLAEAVVAGRVHAVTFTAGPAVRNFMEIARGHGVDGAVRERLTDGSTIVGCVGPVCADAARDEGLASPHLATPPRGRLGPLVRCVSDALAERTIRLRIGGAAVVLAGTSVTIDDAVVTLTDIEAQVLRVLASRPDVVVAKAELLEQVWRDRAADPHVVETVVARLRRRLGFLGRHVNAVYRRGYVLRT
jgi:uroporphyrinogen-III synthase